MRARWRRESSHDVAMWEAHIERHSFLDPPDVLVGEAHGYCGKVGLQLFELASPEDGEDVGLLLEVVGHEN